MVRLENPKQYRNADMAAIMRKAKEVVDVEVQGSRTFDAEAFESLPVFAQDEIVLGRVVGRGGFCVVRECTAIKLHRSSGNGVAPGTSGLTPAATSGHGTSSSHSANTANQRLVSNMPASLHSTNGRSFFRHRAQSFTSASTGAAEGTREYLARRVWSKRGGKYVVKKVEPELFHSDRVTYLKGVIDLALETHYLASLSHPHILEVVGIASSGQFEEGYFLILSQLQDVLSKRLTAWMHRKRATSGLTGALTGGRRKVKELLSERLLVSHDVAGAMEYLHMNNIVFRDLKPDNVGIDSLGVVRLFDFGLAKELREDERDENGLYRMTGFTGGIRYMAPEVGLHMPYNLKADVYSWSMLMWYIMALEPPFGFYSPRMFQDKVHRKGYRPATKEKWPQDLTKLLKQCWSSKIEDRPDFTTIKDVLRKELVLVDPHTNAFLSE